MEYIFFSLGTAGDALPFIKLAANLNAKGFKSVFIGGEKFLPAAQFMNVECVVVSSMADHEKAFNNPITWSANRVKNHYSEFHFPAIKPTFRAIQKIIGQGNRPLVVYQDILSGARMAADEFELKTCHVALAPSAFNSSKSPSYPIRRQIESHLWGEILPQIDRKLKKDRFEKLIRPLINPARKDLGLKEWRIEDVPTIESSPSMLALFPSWLKPVPDDWPQHLINTGFILGDEPNVNSTIYIDEFLDTYAPPAVFTFGTGVPVTNILIDKIRHLCRSIGKPAVFVAHSQPAKFIGNGDFPVLVVPSVPFSYLFSRAALVIHHGGIGTCAQALACGIPQIVSPFTFDQPDNAFLLWQLGISNSVDFLNDSVEQINGVVKEVLLSESVRIKIEEYKALTKDETEASVQYLLSLREKRSTL